MNEVYVKVSELAWVGEYVEKIYNKDLITIEELITVIEDLKSDVDILEEKLEEKEELIAQMQDELKVYDPFNYGGGR